MIAKTINRKKGVVKEIDNLEKNNENKCIIQSERNRATGGVNLC